MGNPSRGAAMKHGVYKYEDEGQDGVGSAIR